jgi:uncharacterized protein YjiS (DUF1127 family)
MSKTMSRTEIELAALKTRDHLLFDSIAGFFRAVTRPLSGWWSRTLVQDELMSLDDRMLADIGISRADIPAVAAGSFVGETISAPRLVADNAKRLWRPETPVAHNEQAAPRVA